ncbi:MAG: adenylosuccinate lyase [Gammaproteobacteria bacterium]|nr:adenylosuccinate lyase [Gammaproteobacteria bacterium]
MLLNKLSAISPVDGRYRAKTKSLSPYFSEFGLIQYRVRIEVEYFIALCELPLPQLVDFPTSLFEELRSVYQHFNLDQAQIIKDIEKETNHDVKAVEYFLKQIFDDLNIGAYKEFIHFGLTSQDVNNTAIPLSIKEAFDKVYLNELHGVLEALDVLISKCNDVPMLARTHGQPASPTRLDKELSVFKTRIEEQIVLLKQVPIAAKFGGATGNFNAHVIAYPNIDWQAFGSAFVEKKLGLKHSFPTTQIEHYDHYAAFCDAQKRINTILIDLARDIWTYISMDYFKQQIKDGEVGSSAMPHKVNPIDFENAEGNLGLANALLSHLAEKLPISRLQRDLTDSTVLRNAGIPVAHMLISFASLVKGMGKLLVNKEKIQNDLDQNWAVLAEAIQTVLRREGYPKPYEALKALTRTNTHIDEKAIREFTEALDVSDTIKAELRALRPENYTGI